MSVSSSASVISNVCAHCLSISNGCAHCCGDEPAPKAKAKLTDNNKDDDCCGDEPPPKAKADCDDDFDKEPAPEAQVKPADDRDGHSGIGGWLDDWDQHNKPAPNANLPDHGYSLGAGCLWFSGCLWLPGAALVQWLPVAAWGCFWLFPELPDNPSCCMPLILKPWF